MLLVDQQKLQQPVMYSINCAHPVHFSTVLTEAKEIKAQWLQRLRSVRANASTRSHAERDDCTELDSGDPADLGRRYADMLSELPHITVLGGCCGTDIRHLNRAAVLAGKSSAVNVQLLTAVQGQFVLEGVSDLNPSALASFRTAIASLANVDAAWVKVASDTDSPLIRAMKGDAVTVNYVVGGLASATDAAVLSSTGQSSAVHDALQACAGAHGLKLGAVVTSGAASRKLQSSRANPAAPGQPDTPRCPNGAISSSGYCCASSCGACGTCMPALKSTQLVLLSYSM
eukprot:17078-Heterococcus_DN1.PRE.1